MILFFLFASYNPDQAVFYMFLPFGRDHDILPRHTFP